MATIERSYTLRDDALLIWRYAMVPAFCETRRQAKRWTLPIAFSLAILAEAIVLFAGGAKGDVIDFVAGPAAVVVVFVLAYFRNLIMTPLRGLHEMRLQVGTESQARRMARTYVLNRVDAELIQANHVRTWRYEGQTATAELAEAVDKWIDGVRQILKTDANAWEGVFVADTGDYGSGVWRPDQSVELRDAMRNRQLARLDRHVERLEEIQTALRAEVN